MINFVEKASDIRLYQVVVTPASQRRAQFPDSIQSPYSGAISITAIEKIGLIDCFQYFGDSDLQQFVCCCRYTQGPQFPIELGYVSSEHQLGPIPAPLHCLHQSFDVLT
jgi:hypothetical protein